MYWRASILWIELIYLFSLNHTLIIYYIGLIRTNSINMIWNGFSRYIYILIYLYTATALYCSVERNVVTIKIIICFTIVFKRESNFVHKLFDFNYCYMSVCYKLISSAFDRIFLPICGIRKKIVIFNEEVCKNSYSQIIIIYFFFI